ncbi:MAG: NAD(P)H-dependent oxidoreductase [Phycisphaerae bacterium]|nr:NAD(P)H-dependent oxidoreductase [Phycisphaerae bacterium]
MRVFIVHAHHEPKSFNGALTATAISTLQAEGHEVVVSDLYAMGFDPVSDRRNFRTVKDATYLKQQVEESHATANDGFAHDLRGEIEKVERCDALIFQFPLWWFGLPAILKGWVDKVFAMGRVYGGGKWYEQGAFRGKRALLSMTTGGSESMYDGFGLNPSLDTVVRPIQHGIFWFTGFEPLEPFVAWAPTRASADERAAMLAAYATRLRRLFTDAPVRYPRLAECDDRFRDRSARFMVSWTWLEPPADHPDAARLDDLVRAERELLRTWRRDGLLIERRISTDETRGWLLFRVRDRAQLDAMLSTLPLRAWLAAEVTEVAAE